MSSCCPPGCSGPPPSGRSGSPQCDAAHRTAEPLGVPAVRPALPDTLVRLPAGRFRMGSDDADVNPGDGEGPVREVDVDTFRIDAVTVDNERFAAFVDATGYVTEAEQYGWSFVFDGLVAPELNQRIDRTVAATPWWLPVPGAYWRAPEGPGTGIDDRADHPVVHVSWHDAVAFCEWAGARLPSETEWEYAARGGLDQARFPWGDELEPDGRHLCNVWQGDFPSFNTLADGYLATAPVDTFVPNAFGLYNVAGNVWEWTADPFLAGRGGAVPAGANRGPVPAGAPRALRGGSYLCHESYCNRYRVAARTANTPDTSAGNIGFRIAA